MARASADLRVENRDVERVGSAAADSRKAAATRDALAAWHGAAGADRRELVEAGSEAGPLRELRIVVANKPGTIAELALTLGEAGVNIAAMQEAALAARAARAAARKVVPR